MVVTKCVQRLMSGFRCSFFHVHAMRPPFHAQVCRGQKALMAAKESRKIIALYNRVARALVEYEVMWHASWLRKVHAARAALDCTLILKDAATGTVCSFARSQLVQTSMHRQFP